MSHLVIVESPAKWKTIEKYLWKDYKVQASFGHIRDLPRKELGIDIDNDFEPTYEITKEKKKRVAELRKMAKASESVLIATDPDREWEAIWWHLCSVLKLDPAKTKKLVFHEITKWAVQEALKNHTLLNQSTFDAQQARRLLDRLVWFKVSPVLWSKVQRWLSAWRVQSVATKLIVEKENDIIKFQPVESWQFKADLVKDNTKFQTILNKIGTKKSNLKNEDEALKILSVLWADLNEIAKFKKNNKQDHVFYELDLNNTFELIKSLKRKSKRKPRPPFITSTLQQEASRKMWFWAKQTMMLAQWLYEKWYITYMRTDSTNLSKTATDACREYIIDKYWKDYSMAKARTYWKVKWAQEAHEAIRPTEILSSVDDLKFSEPKQKKLYDLIWKRTVASQMSDAQVDVTTYTFNLEWNDRYEWVSKWEVITFQWFMKLYLEWVDDEEETQDEWDLPKIQEWEIIESNKILSEQKFTRPPARYTEATLVKKLESETIWRPSTYASIISTIIDRWYIEKRPDKRLYPMEIAFIVTNFLEKNFTEIMDYKFTANTEAEFDKIEKWELGWRKMLWDFYERLKKDLDKTGTIDKVVEKVEDRLCPDCWSELHYKRSKTGKFIWCSSYPECKFLEWIKDEEKERELDILRKKYEWMPCEAWGTIVVKTWRYWPFLASSDYPEVKWIWKIKTDREDILEKILKEKWMLVDEETWEEMVLKNSRRWLFLAAKNYPTVKIAKNIPKNILEEVDRALEEKELEENTEENKWE